MGEIEVVSFQAACTHVSSVTHMCSPRMTPDYPIVLLCSGDPQYAVLCVLSKARSQHCLMRCKTLRTYFKNTGIMRRVCC